MFSQVLWTPSSFCPSSPLSPSFLLLVTISFFQGHFLCCPILVHSCPFPCPHLPTSSFLNSHHPPEDWTHSPQRPPTQTDHRPGPTLPRAPQTPEHFLLHCPGFHSLYTNFTASLTRLHLDRSILGDLLASDTLILNTAHTPEHFLPHCPRFHSLHTSLTVSLTRLNIHRATLGDLLASDILNPNILLFKPSSVHRPSCRSLVILTGSCPALGIYLNNNNNHK